VVDTCAGAGGNLLHLAALMENKGPADRLDIYWKQTQRLKRKSPNAMVPNKRGKQEL